MNKFKVGDHVVWNSEAGRVTGTITRVHLKNVEFKRYTHHATRKIRNMKSKVTNRSILLCIKAQR